MEGNIAATGKPSILRGKIKNISPNALDTSLSVEGAAAEAKATGEAIQGVETKASKHIDNVSNPHGVTKKQIGLGDVDNTADIDKPLSNAQKEAMDNLVESVNRALADKVEMEEGKGLSTNDFTDEYKKKVDDGLSLGVGSVTADKLAADVTPASIGAAKAPGHYYVTISSADWSIADKTAIVSVFGMTADTTKSHATITPADRPSMQKWSECGVMGEAQGENTIAFSCETIPDININLNIRVEEVG